MIIKAEELQMALGGSKILKGIDMEAGDGEFVGLIGPNGCGKSTLLKCIYRVLEPSGGAVMLDGKPIGTYSVKESAKRVGVVSQHNYYNFDFTVREVVLMGRSPHKRALDRDTAEDYEIVDGALKTVGMESFAGRSFSTLSGGEQQRIILARALAQRTPCLVLDEPTNHLDIKYQLQLMDIVKNLGVTVISAVHDLNIAAMYCHRIYAIKNGVITAGGTPREVITPEMIRDIYEVEADVVEDSRGVLRVQYYPMLSPAG